MNRFIRSKKGSAIIWALIVMLVIVMIVGVGLGIASAQFKKTSDKGVANQAYYTAYSVSTAVAKWFLGESGSGTDMLSDVDRVDVLSQMDSSDIHLPFDAEKLGGDMGSCDVTVKWYDNTKEKIDIEASAYYPDENGQNYKLIAQVAAPVLTGLDGSESDGSGGTEDDVPIINASGAGDKYMVSSLGLSDGVAETEIWEYSGAMVPYTVPVSGHYKLETWGAQGGGNSGGKGGYSGGEIYLLKGTKLYIRVGGRGTTSAGGYNDGGNSGGGAGSGGGSSDIRIEQDQRLARVIVAGGGGG
ncbi:MAG: hypothetical protein LBN35_04775, partial [Clostridiales Family XIII bacterium]|nr:hypothetical protein [Clostridiales Family XIII bacterium]